MCLWFFAAIQAQLSRDIKLTMGKKELRQNGSREKVMGSSLFLD